MGNLKWPAEQVTISSPQRPLMLNPRHHSHQPIYDEFPPLDSLKDISTSRQPSPFRPRLPQPQDDVARNYRITTDSLESSPGNLMAPISPFFQFFTSHMFPARSHHTPASVAQKRPFHLEPPRLESVGLSERTPFNTIFRGASKRFYRLEETVKTTSTRKLRDGFQRVSAVSLVRISYDRPRSLNQIFLLSRSDCFCT